MIMSVIIREANSADLLDLATLADDEWKAKISGLAFTLVKCDGVIERCYVAVDSNKLVGFIYGFVLPNKMLLPEMLYVCSEYRKSGIGTMLLEHLEKCSECTCSMIFYNKSLHDYYAKRGYDIGGNLETAMKNLTPTEEVKR